MARKAATIAYPVLGPDVLVLDEPTAGQTNETIRNCGFLDELHQKGHTIVKITHDMQLMLVKWHENNQDCCA